MTNQTTPILAIAVAVALLGLAVAPPTAAEQSSEPNSTTDLTIGEVSISPQTPTTGEKVTITPTIRNAKTSNSSAQVTEVSISGPSQVGVSADNIGSLGPGTSIDIPLSTSFETPGQHQLTVYARGYDADNNLFVVEKPLPVTIKEGSIDVGISATTTSANDSTKVQATITEYGTRPIDLGHVAVVANEQTITRAPISDIKGGQSQTVQFSGQKLPTGNLSIIANYTIEGESKTQSTTTTLHYSPQQSAEMALTGLETIRQGTRYVVSGDASNLGGSDASAVLIDVKQNNTFSSNGGYFIGTVEQSEFATFELAVDATDSVSQIPLRINYSVNGQQFSDTVSINVSDQPVGMNAETGGRPGQQPRNTTNNTGGLPFTNIAIAGGVLLIIASLGAAYRWRNP